MCGPAECLWQGGFSSVQFAAFLGLPSLSQTCAGLQGPGRFVTVYHIRRRYARKNALLYEDLVLKKAAKEKITCKRSQGRKIPPGKGCRSRPRPAQRGPQAKNSAVFGKCALFFCRGWCILVAIGNFSSEVQLQKRGFCGQVPASGLVPDPLVAIFPQSRGRAAHQNERCRVKLCW